MTEHHQDTRKVVERHLDLRKTRDLEGDISANYAPRCRCSALLEWRAHGSRGEIRDGADSFLVEGSLIRYQTIHYTVKKSDGGNR